jgi:ATP-dependent DNA ligase
MAFQRKKPAAIGIKAPFPGFIEPELATAIEKVPSGERWLHEIKFDGYRVQVHLVNEAVKVFTRRGNDWTKRFRKIADDAWHISAGSAIIDGEVVVPAEDGTTDFSLRVSFKQALELGGNVRKGEHGTKVYFVKQLRVHENGADDSSSTRLVPMMREYTVFNVAQCDNLSR